MTKTKPTVSLAELAETVGKPVSSCKTCKNPQVKSDVAEWLTRMIAKKHPPHLKELNRWLAGNRDFRVNISSLRHHCQNHETELWEKAACQ